MKHLTTRHHPPLSALILTAVCAAALCACHEAPRGGLHLSTSLPVIGALAQQLSDSAQVNIMIPQGADHDAYSPKPSQLAALAKANAYVAIGPLEFELQWGERFRQTAPEMAWVDLAEGVDLLQEDHQCSHSPTGHLHADPHYWLSPKSATTLLRNLARALAKLSPQEADSIQARQQRLTAQLESLDTRYQQLRGTAFCIFHPALGYLARDYGLRQLAIGSEGGGTSPAAYAALIEQAKAAGATVLFVQKGLAPESVEPTAAELRASIVELQPEGPDLIGTLTTIAEALERGRR